MAARWRTRWLFFLNLEKHSLHSNGRSLKWVIRTCSDRPLRKANFAPQKSQEKSRTRRWILFTCLLRFPRYATHRMYKAKLVSHDSSRILCLFSCREKFLSSINLPLQMKADIPNICNHVLLHEQSFCAFLDLLLE